MNYVFVWTFGDIFMVSVCFLFASVCILTWVANKVSKWKKARKKP